MGEHFTDSLEQERWRSKVPRPQSAWAAHIMEGSAESSVLVALKSSAVGSVTTRRNTREKEIPRRGTKSTGLRSLNASAFFATSDSL